MHLEVAMFILFIAMFVYHLVYVIFHKQKVLGKVIITNDDSMYIELEDDDSLDEILHSDYVTFKISHK